MSQYSEGQTHQLMEALQAKGYTPEEVTMLGQHPKLGDFRLVLKGLAEIKMMEHIISLDADPLVPDGWRVEEHQKGGMFKWDPAQVKLHLVHGQKNGKMIEGHKLRKELSGKPVLNANVLDYLLAHPHLIPEEWKKGERGNTRHIFFWGTIYRDSVGYLYVRYLYWDGGRWNWYYHWLVHGWDGSGLAALRAS